MYSRDREDGSARTFGVSGKLWHGVLVLFDRETETLWTQLDGRALKGPLKGDRLAHYPSTYTTWGEWREAHPDTLVLKKESEEVGQTASRYADYLADPGRLFREHLAEGLGDVGPKVIVFGVVVGDEALAVVEGVLVRDGVVNDTVGGKPIAFLHDPATGGATAVLRMRGGKEVALERLEGTAPVQRVRLAGTDDVIAVEELEVLRIDRSFWYAWARSHRNSRVLAD